VAENLRRPGVDWKEKAAIFGHPDCNNGAFLLIAVIRPVMSALPNDNMSRALLSEAMAAFGDLHHVDDAGTLHSVSLARWREILG